MSKFILYAHLKSVDSNMKIGNIYNGKHIVGEIGTTGNSSGPHLHFQVEETSGNIPHVSFFYNWGSATRNPMSIIDEYGQVTPNDITLPYKSTLYPYSHNAPHAGVDFSGNIDKSYESINPYTPEFGKVKLVNKGYDKYFGNYLMFQIIGVKEKEKKMNSKISVLKATKDETTYIVEVDKHGAIALDYVLGGEVYTGLPRNTKKLSDENGIIKYQIIVDEKELPTGNYDIRVNVKNNEKWLRDYPTLKVRKENG